MISLVADEAVLTLLRQAKELTEVRDKDGRLIGFFTPITVDQARTPQDKRPGKTTKEVLQRLQSLTADEPMRYYLQQLMEKLEERDRCAIP